MLLLSQDMGQRFDPTRLSKMTYVDMICEYVVAPMTREEAEEYRTQLMEERTGFVDKSDSGYFGQVNLLFIFSRIR